MSTCFFKPHKRIVERINPIASIETIESEPMLFSASIHFALNNGGPITKKILSKLQPLLKNKVDYLVDTKSVMLMPGMFPAIGGWHCDHVPRNGQPILDRMNSDIKNWTCLVSTHPEGVSRTEFCDEYVLVSYDKKEVWGSINQYLNTIPLKKSQICEGEIVEFSQSTLHRAMPTINQGWRYFFRMSESKNPPVNKIRKQIQVYTQAGQSW